MDEDHALAFEREKAASNVLSGQCIEGITASWEKDLQNGLRKQDLDDLEKVKADHGL